MSPCPLAGREGRARTSDVAGAETELRQKRPHSDGRQYCSEAELVDQRRVAPVRRAILTNRADDGVATDPPRPADQWDVPEQHAEQRRLPCAVRPVDRKPLSALQTEVERPEPKPTESGDGS